MTTPPYQPGPYGQPIQDPYGQQSGGGYGQYGPRPPQPPQYGGQWDPERTEQFGPGQAQQFGQPQYGQWPGAPYGGGYQPPEPPKKKTGVIVAIVAVAVLVIAGAGVGLFLLNDKDDTNSASKTTTTTSDSTDTSEDSETTTESETETADPGQAIDAQPGDCIKVNVASETNADVETVDCSTPEAVYKVATREDTDTADCPNDQYVTYSEEGQLLLCLQLNVRDGECLEVTDSQDLRADCASPSATHRVAGVFDGVDDESKCAAEAEAITYPQPPLTVCLVTPAS
ncbi:LppU/SCO3897 family protein [Actinophytocola sp.]|uniref:LppU/SCO3897 family protein n=1 Tax=Actinophytocola sp. TaxID=1872138 RepID=UPI002ED4A0F8